MPAQIHRAPWGKTLVVTSLLATLLVIASVVVLIWKNASAPLPWWIWLAISIPLGTALFMVRGYEIQSGSLLIHRWLWTTRISLHGLTIVEVRPGVMSRSLRLFGNGGLYAFTGWYRNQSLGLYRAWVTDLNRTVVLRLATRTVVISPEKPEVFVAEISQFAGGKI